LAQWCSPVLLDGALRQLTALLADGIWVPMATVHFAAMTGVPARRLDVGAG
jgi:hypothetical protein